MTTDQVQAGIMEERLFLRSAEKCFFGQKCIWSQKNTQNFLRNWYYFWKRVLFFRTTFCSRGQKLVRSKKWAFLGGRKSRVLAQKSDFCHTIPILVDGPFAALGEIVHFPPLGRFFDFAFPSYGRFRGPKKWPHNNLWWGDSNLNFLRHLSFGFTFLKVSFCDSCGSYKEKIQRWFFYIIQPCIILFAGFHQMKRERESEEKNSPHILMDGLLMFIRSKWHKANLVLPNWTLEQLFGTF